MPSDHPADHPVEQTHATVRQRSFTVKSIAFALICSTLIVAFDFINDQYLGGTLLIGNFLPPGPYGLILVLALSWNPTIGRLARLRFATGELAVVLAITLMCAWLPYSGFYRYFQRALIMPQVQADTKPDWRKNGIAEHLPAEAFPLRGSAENWALFGAITAEREALAGGGLDAELAKGHVDRAAYAAALDVAELVPSKLLTSDPVTARTTAEMTLQRNAGRDPSRWASAGELLKGLPDTIKPDEKTPAAWSMAYLRLVAGMAQRLPAAQKEWERVYTGMVQGLPVGNKNLRPDEVPFRAWLPAIAFWAPLIICFTLCILALSLVVHRQWSEHEQMTYPLATVATAMVARSPGSLVSDILRTRLFWWAFIPVLGIHALNYLSIWFPGKLPSITLGWEHWSIIGAKAPILWQSGGTVNIAWGKIFFCVIGLAYFIASEVSFSLGISGFAAVLLGYVFYVNTGTTSDLGSARIGAYLGYAAIMLYTGRSYYWAVLRQACGLGRGGDLREPVWAARIFLLGFVGFTLVLIGAFRLDWFVALAYAATVFGFFLVFTRIVCETGIPFLQAGWQPAQLLVNAFGIGAVGPGPIVLLYWMGTILTQDPRECMMPYVSTSLKLAENTGVNRMRLATVGFGALVLALVIGFVSTTWGLYNFGASKDNWGQNIATQNIDAGVRSVGMLVDTGAYAASASASGLAKVPLMAQNTGKGKELGWMAFGLLAVVLVSTLRFRWAWFPLHPVLLLVWDTYPMQNIWFSFLVGWLVKVAVVKFGGGRVYQSLKPLFLGLIFGELFAVVCTLGCGWVYWIVTGLVPKTYGVFPG